MLTTQNSNSENLPRQENKNNPKPFLAIDGSLTYLFAIAVNLCLQLVAGLFLIILQKAIPSFSVGITANLFIMLLLQIGFVSVYYKNVIFSKRKVKYSLKNKITPLTALLGVLLAFLSIVAFYSLTYWFTFLLNISGFEGSAPLAMNTPFQFVLGCFVLLIAAPICEELIFRSALLSGLRTKYKTVTAVLFSALAFMLMHMSPQQTMYQFLLAIVLGFAVVFSGSPYLSMIIHSVSNLIAVLIDYTVIGSALNQFILFLSGNIALAVTLSILSFVIFGAAIVGVLYLIKKRGEGKINNEDVIDSKIKRDTITNSQKTEPKVVNSNEDLLAKNDKVFYWLAGGICIFMWVVALISGYLPKVV